MKKNQLNDISIFVEVAQANGFRAAAEKLKVGASSVSEAIQRLEDRLGIRLIERTTRKISLTSAGKKLYQRSLPAIKEIEVAVNELNESEHDIAGTLKLTAPISSGPLFLDNLLTQYSVLYPDVQIELIYDDNKIDLVSTSIDAAIRSHTLLELDTHAIPVGPKLSLIMVASQEYLMKNGTPKTPKDILKHDGICYAFGRSGNLAPWQFIQDENIYTVMPKTKIKVNDMLSMLTYAQAGLGLAYLYKETAEPYIKSARLVSILPDKIPQLPSYTINYLSKRNMPARLRAFIELAAKERKCL